MKTSSLLKRKAADIIMSGAALVLLFSSCADQVDNHRIPGLPVQINLANPGLWTAYGVSGVGIWREFIKNERVPAGFPYTEAARTGFGGVLLIGGDAGASGDMAQAYMPIAYDMSCPVEVKEYIRINVDPERLEGVCPVCGSTYSLLGGGFPLSGPARDHDPRYGLQVYRCIGSNQTGYMIVN